MARGPGQTSAVPQQVPRVLAPEPVAPFSVLTQRVKTEFTEGREPECSAAFLVMTKCSNRRAGRQQAKWHSYYSEILFSNKKKYIFLDNSKKT